MSILPVQKTSAFKVGPNKVDQLKIQTLAKDGVSAEEISQRLKIQLGSIEGWMPKKPKPKKAATKKKAKKEDK